MKELSNHTSARSIALLFSMLVFLGSIGFTGVHFVRAKDAAPTNQQGAALNQPVNPPLAELLNPDGTLNLASGFSGSLDPNGWQMTLTDDGAPKFVKPATPMAPGDENWSAQFNNSLGISGSVRAVAISGGDIYVGGFIAGVGGMPVSNIAKWNGSTWSALGSGVNEAVVAIAVNGGDVYVGGVFNVAGGVAASRIAKWNGSAWSALGSGVNDNVLSIVVSGGNVYAGGRFTTAGGVSANRIAKWDGSNWSALGSGIGGEFVQAIAVSGTDVYAGGPFTTAGGNPANLIAKWNGSNWSALGSGISPIFNPTVAAIGIIGSDVYVGGSFSGAGGFTAVGIAKWNGSSWSAVGGGLNGSVNALTVSGGEVYVGGSFTMAGGSTANRIAKWDGTSWSAFGDGANGTVVAIAVAGSQIYAGGAFANAGGQFANGIAKWDGAGWSSFGSGTNNSVNYDIRAMAVSGSDVYVGGFFTAVANMPAGYIAKWNGSSWSTLSGGVNGFVYAIAINGSDVYVGGTFSSAGGVSALRVAKWNGSWSALGAGIGGTGGPSGGPPVGTVFALATIGTDVYVGGSFTVAGITTAANNIAKWNGSSWSALGTGTSSLVYALAVIGSDLYAGGAFSTAGGNLVNRIAKWNGTSWSALGSGVTSDVLALIASGGSLYVGGFFTHADGNPVNYIARWDGFNWFALGSGMSAPVYALTAYGGNVYAGGFFATAGGITVNCITKWDGSSWSALGSGIGGLPRRNVWAVAATGSKLYVGGYFGTAGLNPSPFFAAFSTCPVIAVGPESLPNAQIGVSYNQALGASGGMAPYSFGVTSGALPGNVTLSPAGLLAGAPTQSGTFNFTVTATDLNGCSGAKAYTLIVNQFSCPAITIGPVSLPNSFIGIAYGQTVTASGGAPAYTFSISSGSLPGGLSLSPGGALAGTPAVTGTFTFTIKAIDTNGCVGERSYSVIISGSGLHFYPLPFPVRLLETRAGFAGCTNPGSPISAGTTFPLPARTACAGIPANAAAVTGNITVVPSESGFLTLFPSSATQPTVANSNFGVGEITNNVFTVALGAGDGAFKIFTNATTHIIADVTGYYAPPGTGGLYFHPLATPVRLLETRTGLSGCFAPGTPLTGTGDPNADPNLDLALQGRSPIPSPCNSIPASAQVLVGNATSVFPSGGGYLTIYPSGGTRPTVASSNYAGGDVINGPFAVKLGADGKFKIYTYATTHLVVDILGYYSEDATDANGAGLLFNPLPAPVRLLETRPDFPGFPLAGCTRTNAQIPGNLAMATHTQQAAGFCGLPTTAQAVVGNVSVVNSGDAGFLTLFPGNLTTAPLVATSNYPAPATFGYNRHYFVGLSPADGTFKVLTQFTMDLILDASGYFAP